MKRKIRPLQLAAIVFFTVSGGPYGLEPLLQHGGGAALLLLIITPMLWDIPSILTVLELNGMMPVTGGYYVWVKRALGLRFGFYEGMWTWFYTFVDLAIYPVLFVQYASFLLPQLEAYKIPVCLVIVWSSACLNIIGIVPVGKVSLILSGLVLTPFLMLFVYFMVHSGSYLALPSPSLKGLTYPSLGLALYTIMWNFFGWDSITTYAEEVENPVRSYLLATGIAFVTVIAVYVGVVVVAQRSGINAQVLAKEGFPALGRLVAGRWLGILIAAGGMASTVGLYNANLLSVSRIPQVMSADGLLPRGLNKLHSRFGTPYISIITCSVVISLMTVWSFGDLLIIDVTIYGAGLFLEYFSLIRLRTTMPDAPRPFRIPVGIRGLCAMIMFPIMVYVLALTGVCASTGDALKPALFSIGILLFTDVLWRIAKQNVMNKKSI